MYFQFQNFYLVHFYFYHFIDILYLDMVSFSSWNIFYSFFCFCFTNPGSRADFQEMAVTELLCYVGNPDPEAGSFAPLAPLPSTYTKSWNIFTEADLKAPIGMCLRYGEVSCSPSLGTQARQRGCEEKPAKPQAFSEEQNCAFNKWQMLTSLPPLYHLCPQRVGEHTRQWRCCCTCNPGQTAQSEQPR